MFKNNNTEEWDTFNCKKKMTDIKNKKEVNNRKLIYMPKYVNTDDPLFDEDDA